MKRKFVIFFSIENRSTKTKKNGKVIRNLYKICRRYFYRIIIDELNS